jgi:hypothetical protein
MDKVAFRFVVDSKIAKYPSDLQVKILHDVEQIKDISGCDSLSLETLGVIIFNNLKQYEEEKQHEIIS